jgi:hypothetical protein
MNAVDPDAPWVKVRRQLVQTMAYEWSPTIAIEAAFVTHPSARVKLEALQVSHMLSISHLPVWMQERIAVLNIADAGTWIRGVGKRWPYISSARRGDWRLDTSHLGRQYTLDVNCEGVES